MFVIAVRFFFLTVSNDRIQGLSLKMSLKCFNGTKGSRTRKPQLVRSDGWQSTRIIAGELNLDTETVTKILTKI